MKKILSAAVVLLLTVLFVAGCGESDARKRKKSRQRKSEINILSSTRARRYASSSLANLKQIGTAIIMYCDDNNGYMPQDIFVLKKANYIPADVFKSPFDSKCKVAQAESSRFTPENISYVYIDYSPVKLGEIKEPYMIVLAYEHPKILKCIEGKAVNVLFADGHVENVKAPEDVDFSAFNCKQMAEHFISRGFNKSLQEQLIRSAEKSDIFFAGRKF